jgi:hypothetical protein
MTASGREQNFQPGHYPILTRPAKPSNSTASRCAVWNFETRRAGPAKDAPVAPPS